MKKLIYLLMVMVLIGCTPENIGPVEKNLIIEMVEKQKENAVDNTSFGFTHFDYSNVGTFNNSHTEVITGIDGTIITANKNQLYYSEASLYNHDYKQYFYDEDSSYFYILTGNEEDGTYSGTKQLMNKASAINYVDDNTTFNNDYDKYISSFDFILNILDTYDAYFYSENGRLGLDEVNISKEFDLVINRQNEISYIIRFSNEQVINVMSYMLDENDKRNNTIFSNEINECIRFSYMNLNADFKNILQTDPSELLKYNITDITVE